MQIKLKLVFVTAILIGSTSCSKNEVPNREADEQLLLNLATEIRSQAAAESCENAEDWKFTPIGSKACGGPTGYLPYSVNIDTVLFFRLVEAHRLQEQEFNETWGVVSDCALALAPTDVICEDGKPVLVFGNGG